MSKGQQGSISQYSTSILPEIQFFIDSIASSIQFHYIICQMV